MVKSRATKILVLLRASSVLRGVLAPLPPITFLYGHTNKTYSCLPSGGFWLSTETFLVVVVNIIH